MNKVNPNLRPPGGWFFIDAEGMRHEAEDLSTLVTNLGLYRGRTGREFGDPATEVQDQVCERTPGVRINQTPLKK